MNRKALINATVVGTIAQLGMVIGGHFNPFVKENLFALLGTLLSLFAGLLYARAAREGWRSSLLGGVIAGGLCALLGIVVSWLLGDVQPIILVIGTLSSAAGGLIGGAIGKVLK